MEEKSKLNFSEHEDIFVFEKEVVAFQRFVSPKIFGAEFCSVSDHIFDYNTF